jgi:hypothetical protein
MMTAFWHIAPFNLVKVDRRFKDAYYLHHQGDLCIVLMMGAVSIPEMSVSFNETTQRQPIYQKAVILNF